MHVCTRLSFCLIVCCLLSPMTAAPFTPRSHCTHPLTDLIDFAWGALEMHCGSVRSVGSVACVKKLRNVQLFRQQRIHRPIRSHCANTLLWRYLDSVQWNSHVIQPGKKHGCVKKPAGSWGFKNATRSNTPCDYGIHFAITERKKKKQEKGFVSGKRFHWLEATSPRTIPLYVRHALREALRHPAHRPVSLDPAPPSGVSPFQSPLGFAKPFRRTPKVFPVLNR